MRRMACASFAVAVAGVAATVAAADVVETRQRLMVSMIGATKIVRAMVRGETPFDPAQVQESAVRVLEASKVLPTLFPDGSITPASATLPVALTNRADFNARFLDLEKFTVGLVFAAQQGPEELASAFGEYSEVCDSCHEAYRKPD